MMLRLSDLGSMKPRVLPPDQKDDRDENLRDVDDVFNNNYDGRSNDKSAVFLPVYNRDEITKRNQTGSPLLLLPAELRNDIYNYVFNGAIINVNKPLVRKDIRRYRSVRAIVYTCRQCYMEANRMSFNLCSFEPSYFALRFFSSSNLPAGGFGKIERLWLTQGIGQAIIEGQDEMKSASLKEEFASLKYLEIEVWRMKVNLTDAQAKQKLRDAFGLPNLHIVGRHRVEDAPVAA